jgi:SpoIIAA-like
MLEQELIADSGVLIVRPKGPLSESDFAALSAEADAYIQNHGALKGLMIEAEKFPGWENLDGFISHFKFIRGHIKNIGKIAFVSDSDVLALLPRLASFFVSADVRHFKDGEKQAALAWIVG